MGMETDVIIELAAEEGKDPGFAIAYAILQLAEATKEAAEEIKEAIYDSTTRLTESMDYGTNQIYATLDRAAEQISGSIDAAAGGMVDAAKIIADAKETAA